MTIKETESQNTNVLLLLLLLLLVVEVVVVATTAAVVVVVVVVVIVLKCGENNMNTEERIMHFSVEQGRIKYYSVRMLNEFSCCNVWRNATLA